MDDFEPFTHLHALFLAGSVITYLVDVALDVVLAVTYFTDGYPWYCVLTVILVLFPNIIVQIFSIRWHQMDEAMEKGLWTIHACLLGVVHRYLSVISLGLEAMRSADPIDYRRFYHQQSDVSMLRLFDSFLESAPQLVFHLYVVIKDGPQQTSAILWTSVSAVAAMISLGWGIAAYSSSMRMVRAEKEKMTWAGMILQTIWRFGMLSARIAALVLLALAIDKWLIIILCKHEYTACTVRFIIISIFQLFIGLQ